MRVKVEEQARRDLLDGWVFYENCSPGWGDYFDEVSD